MKKKITIILTAIILSMNTLTPIASAIDTTKPLKANVKEYKYDYINPRWWENFNDEYLSEYINKAIENNYDLKIATLKVGQYHQMKNIQLSEELPQIGVGFSPNLVKMPSSTVSSGLYALPMVVNYELDIFLKNRDKTRSAKKVEEASKIEEQAAYIAIAAAVGASYLNIVKLDKLIEIQKEIITSREQIYNMMNLRNKEGVNSTADLLRADKARIAAKSDLIELEKARIFLLNSFAVLIGESPANVNDFKRTKYCESVYSVHIPNSINSEIIEGRPDYQKAQKMVEKAGIDVRIAKKEFLPSFDIFGMMLFNSNNFGKTLNWSSMIGSIGGAALLPVFTGGKRIANVKLRKNVYEQVLNSYQKTNLTAIQEVNDSLSRLKLDDEKYKTNKQVYAMEKKDFEYNQKRYQQGIISELNLIQRKENMLTIEKLVTTNKVDAEISQIGLYKATATKI